MSSEKTFESSMNVKFIQNGCLVDKVCLYYDPSTDDFTDYDGCSYFGADCLAACAEQFVLTVADYFDVCRNKDCGIVAYFRTTEIGASEDDDISSLWKVTIPTDASNMDHDEIFDQLINHYIFDGSNIVVGARDYEE